MIPDARTDREYQTYERERLAMAAAASVSRRDRSRGRWRAFEDTNPGYWGIELEDADNDDDAILHPQNIHRDTAARVVEAHNEALSAPHVVVTSDMVNAAWNAGKHRRMNGSTSDFRSVLVAALAAMEGQP